MPEVLVIGRVLCMPEVWKRDMLKLKRSGAVL